METPGVLLAVGAGVLAGALVLGGSSGAVADEIRDRQWDLKFYDADDIWKHSTGKGTTVAVVDSGVDAKHRDLTGHVLEGKDFTDSGDARKDNDGHGTRVAGVVAAHGHGAGQKSGMRGLAPEAKILPVKVDEMDPKGDAIRYAVAQDVDVITVAYSSIEHPDERKAVNEAIAKDIVVVSETGDEGSEAENFPAAYPGVVSVGALDRDGHVSADSSWGSNTTLVAPGEELVSPDRTKASGYSFFNGTSAAAAQVSGAAALVRAEHPDLTAGQVINRLVKTALPLTDAKGKTPKLPDEKFGYGVVRPFRAVTYDVSVGPAAGPLEQPKPESSESAEPVTSSSSDDSMGWMFILGPPIVLFTVVFLLLVALAVMVIVLWSRKSKKKAAPQNPVGAGWGAQQPGHPPGQYGAAPYGQPPVPYQGPPQPSPGQFGQPPAAGPVPPPGPHGPPPRG